MRYPRTFREIELLKARQLINDALIQLMNRKSINIRLYKKLIVKLLLCEELLIEERKHKLKLG